MTSEDLIESYSVSVEDEVPFSVENYTNELIETLKLDTQSIASLNTRIVAHFVSEQYPALRAKNDAIVKQIKALYHIRGILVSDDETTKQTEDEILMNIEARANKSIKSVQQNPEKTAKLILNTIPTTNYTHVLDTRTVAYCISEQFLFMQEAYDEIIEDLTETLNLYGQKSKQTLSQVEAMLNTIDKMHTQSGIQNNLGEAVGAENVKGNSHVSSSKMYRWRNEEHPFPADFKFPCVDSAKLWNLWLFGNGNDINTPYRSFRGDFMSKPDRIQLSKSRTLMEAVRTEIGMSYVEIQDSGRDRSEQLFDVAFKSLFGGVKGYKRMNSANAYKYLMKFRKVSN